MKRAIVVLALLALAGCAEENIVHSPERGDVAPWLRLDRKASLEGGPVIYALCDTQNWNLIYFGGGAMAVVKEGCKP